MINWTTIWHVSCIFQGENWNLADLADLPFLDSIPSEIIIGVSCIKKNSYHNKKWFVDFNSDSGIALCRAQCTDKIHIADHQIVGQTRLDDDDAALQNYSSKLLLVGHRKSTLQIKQI